MGEVGLKGSESLIKLIKLSQICESRFQRQSECSSRFLLDIEQYKDTDIPKNAKIVLMSRQ